MRWLRSLSDALTRWLERQAEDDSDDPFGHMLGGGFQRVYLMGTEGQPFASPDLVGWFVEEENRCWRFEARPDDPTSWPQLAHALIGSIHRPDELIVQFVIDDDNQCWWAEETLVLRRCSNDYLLARLTPYPAYWTEAARRLGLGTISRWAT